MKVSAILTITLSLLDTFVHAAFAAEGEKNMSSALSPKQQAIVPIAAFTAVGDTDGLKNALNEGLGRGLTINEIKEVLVQLYAYAGFPRSLNALDCFSQVLKERQTQGITDETGREAGPLPAGKTNLELGTEVQTKLVGAPVEGGLMDFAPAVDYFLKAHLFGDIFGRDNLDWQSREIATVSALANIDGADGQFRSHCNISLNVGLAPEQLKELAAVLGSKVSKPVGERAARSLDEVLSSRS